MKILSRKIMVVVAASLLGGPSFAQEDRCKELRTGYEAVQHDLFELGLRWMTAENFTEVMKFSKVNGTDARDEMTFNEKRIKEIQAKINGGDASPALADELRYSKDRVELVKLRLGNTLSSSQFFNLPKYKEQENLRKTMGQGVVENIAHLTQIRQDLEKANCPLPEMTGYPPEVAAFLGQYWSGTWHFAENNMTMQLQLSWSGAILEGTGIFDSGRKGSNKSTYRFSNGRWDRGNTVTGDFVATLEDEEKFTETRGTLTMIRTGRTLNTTWTESGKPTIRWKPGKENKNGVLVRDPLAPYSLLFKR